jgi:glycerol-3-phosphate dehydrogenase
MYDITIIGCGVIGASIAYQLSQYKLRVLVLEQENDIAMGTTKANSAIVHAGYDPEPGSLMAKLNVQGTAMMADLCKKLSVEYKNPGSLVLAFSDEEMKTVQKMYDQGVQNGVPNQQILTAAQVHEMEPALSDQVVGALYAPSAGIVDPWGLCIAEAEVAVKNGVEIKLRAKVTGIAGQDGQYTVSTTAGDFTSRYVVNCAGVSAEEVAKLSGGADFQTKPSRGEYYLLDKTSGSLVNHVIFQCPTAAGKGILVSPTVHGNLIVGPNAHAVAGAYDRNTTYDGLQEVARTAKKSVPSLDLRQSIRNFAGVRANTDHADFVITWSKKLPGVLNVGGIKSPGLSAAPAIGVYVVELLEKAGVQLTKNPAFQDGREQVRFRKLNAAQKAELIQKNPLYGRIICRCETITEGEIVDAIHSPIPPCSIDGVKRRANAGMGRCQGGFCGPRVMEILARELKKDQKEILQDQDGTFIIVSETKGGAKA